MAIAEFFIQIARDKLDPAVFADIQAKAVAAERRRVEAQPTLPAVLQVDRPNMAARVEAHLRGLPKPKLVPHPTVRIEERLDIKIGPNDLGELAQVVRAGGPNVKVNKQVMEAVLHCTVDWRGKHFTVLFSKSRDQIITAYPYRKQKPLTRPIARKPVRERPVRGVRDIHEEDEDGHDAAD